MRIPIRQVKQFRDQNMTFREIGEYFGVTRQRIHQIFTQYPSRYQKQTKWKVYKRHYNHSRDKASGRTTIFEDCVYCINEDKNKDFVNILDMA